MASSTPVQDDPKQLKNAENLWNAFMKATKWSIIGIVLIVIALAIAFVPTGS